MPQHAFPARSYARAIIMLFIAWLSSSADVTLKSDDTVQVVVKGFGALQNGQIVSGHYASQTAGSNVKMDHLWLQKGFVNLGTAITYHQRLQVALELEGKIWRDEAYSNYLEMWEIPEKNYSFYIPRAEAEYAFPDIGPLSVRLGMGIFPYKYNSDVRNLGEYLFRTRTYPNLVKNEFDMPYARCTGVKLQTELAGILFQDILFTSETDLRPVYDFSLSYIGSISVMKVLKIGAGVDFDRILPVNPAETTPHTLSNVSEINGTDTTYYSFAGIKPMARISFDPKPMLPFAGIFGKEDLRIYGEAAILGAKKYAGFYDTLMQRMPMMFGFNLPAFKVLDVLSIEAEWFDSPYPNSYISVINGGPPVPDVNLVLQDPHSYRVDSWKWSLYAKKTLFSHFIMTFQAARDHIFTEQNFADTRDRQETLIKSPDHWWWVLKFGYNL